MIGKAIINKLNARFHVQHVPYAGHPMAVLNQIAGLSCIIAMRLHAAIFGYLTGTPTVMISYHPKCLGWASQIGMPPELIIDSNDFEVDQLSTCIRDVISGKANTPTLLPVQAQNLAVRNWTWTRDF